MTSIVDLVDIDVETPRIDSRCSLKKEFAKLIRMNLQMISCQIINQVDSCHVYVRGLLT